MSSQETRQDTDTLKTLLENFSDYLLWGGIISVLCLLYGFFAIYLPSTKQQTITVAFKDANEINHGSIVRMMGTEIGYVDKVQLNDDHVDITMKTFPNAPKIPSGSMFSIKFTGLVGAKSIEVITNDTAVIREPGSEPVYTVEEPIRMRESLEYQIDIAQALQRGAENFTDVFGKKKPLEEVEYNIHLAQKAVQKGNEGLIKTKQAFENAQKDFGGDFAQVNHSISNFAKASEEAAYLTSRSSFKYDTVEVLHHTLNGVISAHDKLVGINDEHRLSNFNNAVDHIDTGIRDFGTQVSSSNLGQNLNNTVDNLSTFDKVMASGKRFFNQDFSQPFNHARMAVRGFNHKLVYWYNNWFVKKEDKSDTKDKKND